jgi:hypothetical protein
LPDKTTAETKDFAEHLRSVHFSLAAVCLGLLVVVSQPTRPELRTAYEQAREISQVSLVMDKDLVEKEASRQVHGSDIKESPAFGNLDGLQSTPKAIDIAGEKYDVVFDGRNWGFLPLDHFNPMLDIDPMNGSTLAIKSPKTLADFRILWDDLTGLTAWGGGSLSKHVALVSGSTLGGSNEVWTSWKPIDPSPAYKTLHFALGFNKFSDDSAIPSDIKGHFRHVFMSNDGSSQLFIPTVTEIPVADVDGRSLLIRRVDGHWRNEPYVRSFEELYAVTQKYESINLDAIQRIVQSELERSKDVFQAFGVTFPIETTGLWGIFVVLSVQVYFLFHLAEFRKRDMSNVSVAWIGLYRSWGPRILFSVTAFLMPVLVVSYVAPRVHFNPLRLPEWSILTSLILLTGGAAVMALVEYYKIQRGMSEVVVQPEYQFREDMNWPED